MLRLGFILVVVSARRAFIAAGAPGAVKPGAVAASPMPAPLARGGDFPLGHSRSTAVLPPSVVLGVAALLCGAALQRQHERPVRAKRIAELLRFDELNDVQVCLSRFDS